MRPTILLLSDPDTRREIEDRLRDLGTYADGDVFDRLEVGDCWFGIDLSGDVLHDYDEDENAELAKRFGAGRADSRRVPGYRVCPAVAASCSGRASRGARHELR